MALWVILFLLLVFLLFWLYAIAPRLGGRPDLSRLRQFDYAHRGLHTADRTVPENSMAAFRQAVEKGYGMELDLQLTKDGQVVIHHDNSLKRVCGVDKQISDLSYEELKEYKLYHTEESCPLFSELLAMVGGRTPLIIEYKGYGEIEKLCQAAWEILKDYRGDYCVESFHPLIVAWFRENHPEVIRGQLMSATAGREKGKPLTALGSFFAARLFTNFITRPDFEAYDWHGRNKLSLKLARSLFRIQEVSWTVRDPETFRKLKKDGCICIFENFEP